MVSRQYINHSPVKGLASKDSQTAKIELNRLVKYIGVNRKVEWVGSGTWRRLRVEYGENILHEIFKN